MSSFNLKKILDNNISTSEMLLLFFSVMLICPFFLLSYYNNPSADDFAFVYTTSSNGFWKAQVSWYMIWTGRYGSLFILSLHPLLIHSLLLYKASSVIILSLTIHSIYTFLRITFNFLNKAILLSLSLVITFCFLNSMPTLVQGIYWAPGAITYQLGNILSLYLATNIIRSTFKNYPSSIPQIIFNCLLIILICGLNETSMITLDFILFSFLSYQLFKKQSNKKEIIVYMCLAVVCSLVVILSPGNAIRGAEFVNTGKNMPLHTIISSFKEGYSELLKWCSTSQLLIASVFTALSYLAGAELKDKINNNKFGILLFVLWGYLLIAVSFSTGFWSTGFLAPDRTINVSYWLFICIWVSTVLLLTSYVHSALSILKKYDLRPLTLLFLLFLICTIKTSGNFYGAQKDLLSGKAFTYNKEYRKRNEIMTSSQDSICNVPSFSVYPRSLFNEDITPDIENWWNRVYAFTYNKKGVRVFFKEPYFSFKRFFNFEAEENKVLDGQRTITNEIAYSLPNSSVMRGADSYSITFRESLKNTGFDDIYEITSANLRAQFYSTDSIVNAVMVFCIIDPATGKNLMWEGKELTTATFSKNKWINKEFTIPIKKEFLKPENKVVVYAWNRGQGTLYIDDLSICIY